jgi:hypothetical protein
MDERRSSAELASGTPCGSVPVRHDNALVYRDLLGVSDQELEDLRQRHVV